jgi:hypothetical protein
MLHGNIPRMLLVIMFLVRLPVILLVMLLVMLLAKIPEKFMHEIVPEMAPDNPGGYAQRKNCWNEILEAKRNDLWKCSLELRLGNAPACVSSKKSKISSVK